LKLLLSWFIIIVVYAVPAIGIYEFAIHCSGIGALLCYAFSLVMSIICARALGDS